MSLYSPIIDAPVCVGMSRWETMLSCRAHRTNQVWIFLLLWLLCIASAHAQDALANNTVLIIRHAEKPAEILGSTGLTERGQHRAEAYVQYFQHFHEGDRDLKVSALYAGQDSSSSVRPRLTLEPLSKALGLPLDSAVSTKEPGTLLAALRTHAHGRVPLICWRHKQIPALLSAFGVPPKTLLPEGKWPDEVYDWVLVLHFDAQSRVVSQELVNENLIVR